MIDGWGSLQPRRRLSPGEIALFATLALGAATVVLVVGWMVLTLLGPVLELPFNRVDVELEATAIVVDGTVRVTGTTDLPEGANLAWRIGPALVGTPLAEGSVEVRDGAFAFSADAGDWPWARVYATVELFIDDEQPQAVRDRYGDGGERMDGPDVQRDSGDAYLSVDVEVRLPRP
jgi:hypothetical protein